MCLVPWLGRKVRCQGAVWLSNSTPFAPDSTLTFVFLFMPIELPRRDSEEAELGVIGGLHPAVPPALCGETGGLARLSAGDQEHGRRTRPPASTAIAFTSV